MILFISVAFYYYFPSDRGAIPGFGRYPDRCRAGVAVVAHHSQGAAFPRAVGIVEIRILILDVGVAETYKCYRPLGGYSQQIIGPGNIASFAVDTLNYDE